MGFVTTGKEGLGSLGRILTNRGEFGYLRGANIVKNHTLSNVVAHHRMSVDFIKKVGYSEPVVFQDEFGEFLMAIGEFLDTEIPVGDLDLRTFTMPQSKPGKFREMASGIKK